MIDVSSLLTAGSAVTSGEVLYPPGSVYGPVTQVTVEVGIVHEGSVTAVIDGTLHEISAGTAFLVLPGQRARYRFAACNHSWMHVWSEHGFPDAALERLRRLPATIALSSALAREMRELLDLGASRLPTRDEIALMLGHRILYQFVGEAELADGTGVVASGPVDRALRHIDEHLASALTLEEVARAASVSTSHLIRLFHEQLDTTPSRHVWTRRLERGVELLQETGLGVGEIATRCGFRTSHHFSRRIREFTGATPTELRLQTRTGAALNRSRRDPGG